VKRRILVEADAYHHPIEIGKHHVGSGDCIMVYPLRYLRYVGTVIERLGEYFSSGSMVRIMPALVQ